MTEFSLSIRTWYRQNGRNLPWRESNDPYLIWLSEIILQQTRVDQGTKYYLKFKSNYPTVHELAAASEQQILKDWQGLGYYSRARNLHFSAKTISQDLNGVFPNTYSEIIKLKGVGSYTAAAISSFAFGEQKAVVDGNVYRLLSRVFDIDTPIDSTEGKKQFQLLADELISKNEPGNHNQAIMEMGALICKPKLPECDICPLNSNCLARENETFNNRPVKSKKTKVRDRHFHFLLFNDQKNTIIEQRGDKDIWRNMFQFPLIESKDLPQHKYGPTVRESGAIKHILSHQNIFATFHHFDQIPENLDENWRVIRWEDLEEFPIPRLIDKYLDSQFRND